MLNDRLLQDERSFSSEAGEEQSNKKGAEAPPSSLLQQKYLQFTIVELHFRQNHGRTKTMQLYFKACNFTVFEITKNVAFFIPKPTYRVSKQVLDWNLTKKVEKNQESLFTF